jgi:hypothetical protein
LAFVGGWGDLLNVASSKEKKTQKRESGRKWEIAAGKKDGRALTQDRAFTNFRVLAVHPEECLFALARHDDAAPVLRR